MKKILLLSLMCLSGCITKEIVIDPVKSWENHYMTIEDFKNGTKDIYLDNDESIWVLSNKTFKRFLDKINND